MHLNGKKLIKVKGLNTAFSTYPLNQSIRHVRYVKDSESYPALYDGFDECGNCLGHWFKSRFIIYTHKVRELK
jgi:hypothetical protein